MTAVSPLPPDGEAAVIAAWDGVSVRYPYAKVDAVGPADITVRSGERVLLLGPSGSGKSTLLLTLTALIPDSVPARVTGRTSLFGRASTSQQPWEWAALVAQYFQDSDQTLCGMRVEEEIAFALENRAVSQDAIAVAVARTMREVGLPDAFRQRRVATLSGGERQLVALAAVLAQATPLVVVDEPTAHLAPQAARRLQSLLMAKRPGKSVIVVDHRLDGLIRFIDRVVVLGAGGRVVADGPPRRVFRERHAEFASAGTWSPVASILDAALIDAGVAAPEPPLSVGEALAHLEAGIAAGCAIRRARSAAEKFLAGTCALAGPNSQRTPVVATLAGADCAPFLGPTVLRGVTLDIHEGETVGVLGANGAGKSTLGLSLAGLLRLKAGRRYGPPAGVVFQGPDVQLLAASVLDEIRIAFPNPISEEEMSSRAAAALRDWGLSEVARRHPLELSHGQKRSLALAALTANPERWRLLVLDEPLAGLDAAGAAWLVDRIETLNRRGHAIALITHDVDFALRLCARCVILGEGRILAGGPTPALLQDNDLLRRAGLEEPSTAPARRWLRRVEAC